MAWLWRISVAIDIDGDEILQDLDFEVINMDVAYV